MAGQLGSPLAYREFDLSVEVYPALIRYMSILFINILTLVAPTQSADNLFLILLFVVKSFLITSIHCFFIATSCLLVRLSYLTEKHISVNIFIRIQYFKHLTLISSQSPGV